ncbi:MAG: dynamin family protein [Culicoidibacterales bacterium]
MNNGRKKWQEKQSVIETQVQEAKKLVAELKKEQEKLDTQVEKNELFDLDFTPEFEKLSEKINKVKNNEFEIVVIGEFSTGKSTFINALIGKEVLPSHSQPATATINYLKHVDRNGGKEVARVYYNDGKTEEIPFTSLTDFVTEQTNKNIKVADIVKRVDIFVKSKYLEDGVVIIDTPGMQSLCPEHEKITKDKIKTANASILLFNAGQTGKLTEFQFLKEVKEHIDRVFFVVNRIDTIPVNEVADVLDGLRKNLADNPICPITAIDNHLYGVSALKALAARDVNVEYHFNQSLEKQELEESSNMTEFENRLENYLFDGEKNEDLFAVPANALQYFYETMSTKIENLSELVNEQFSLENFEDTFTELQAKVELRKQEVEANTRKLIKEVKEIFEESQKYFYNELAQKQQAMISRYANIDSLAEYNQECDTIHRTLSQTWNILLNEHLDELKANVQEKISDALIGSDDISALFSSMTAEKIECSGMLQTVEISKIDDTKIQEIEAKIENLEDKYSQNAQAKATLQQLQLEKAELLAEKKQRESDYTRNVMQTQMNGNTKIKITEEEKRTGIVGVIVNTFVGAKKVEKTIDNVEYYKTLDKHENNFKAETSKIRSVQQNLTREISSLTQNLSDTDQLNRQMQKLEREAERLFQQQLVESNEQNASKLKKIKREIEYLIEDQVTEVKSHYRTSSNNSEIRKTIKTIITQSNQNVDQDMQELLTKLEAGKKLQEDTIKNRELYNNILEQSKKQVKAQQAITIMEVL